MKRIFALLVVLGIFGLACTISIPGAGESAATPQVVTVLVQATALPTYTPYPTLAQPTAIPYVAPTAKPKMGASDGNTCAIKISAMGISFYAVMFGPELASACPTLAQQMRAADTESLMDVTIVNTFPTEPVICHKDYGSNIEIFVVDTGSDTRLSEAFCGGLNK